MIKRLKHIVNRFFAKHQEEADEYGLETLAEREPDVSAINAQLTKLMQKDISWRVTGGFDSRDSIITSAVNVGLIECQDDRFIEWLYAEATRLADETLRFHMQMEASWSHETDCDRLDEAFAELDRNGILVRQNFTCCANCGFNGIWNEIRQAEAQSIMPFGYVFFHQADLIEVLSYGRLHLSFGATFSETEAGEHTAYIGNQIVKTLQRHGLAAAWNGSANQRIHVGNLNWQRRRFEMWEVADVS